MIPVAIAVFFLLMSAGCFYYIFRWLTSNDNPVLGNILATGLNTIICAFFVAWFVNGAITDVTVVENQTFYANYATIGGGNISAINNAMTTKQYQLDADGAGMYTIKAINSPTIATTTLANLTVEYSTHDIVYTQYQERGLSYFFILLALINAALFLWFAFSAGWPAVTQFVGGSRTPQEVEEFE